MNQRDFPSSEDAFNLERSVAMSLRQIPIGLRRIFNPSDFSEASNVAFAHALKLTLASHGHLTILHTGKLRKNDRAEFPQVRRTFEAWQMLPAGSLADDLRHLEVDVEKVVLPGSDRVRSIVRYLHKHPHDLIVLATHQNDGLHRWIHEPVAEPIVRGAAKLALFVPSGTDGFVSVNDGSISLRKILIPVDHAPDPQGAIYAAITIAEALGCRDVEATVLHVSKTGIFPKCSLPETPAIAWSKTFREGPVAEVIMKSATEQKADLIVMSTQGHQGFLDALRGSTTERIVRHARCPVLAVPSYLVFEPAVSTLEALAAGQISITA
jgi:nucleotide-binding universal stress UspA family protein